MNGVRRPALWENPASEEMLSTDPRLAKALDPLFVRVPLATSTANIPDTSGIDSAFLEGASELDNPGASNRDETESEASE